MKRILLLTFSMATLTLAFAQKQKTTAYAITGLQKGNTAWTEVRLVDIVTGEEIQSVYQSSSDAQILNARSGKPIVKKEGESLKANADLPFATNSAACAYDKKNNRLYYTPMGINQLRYIDLKAKTPKVYYFEEEAFGVVKGRHDVSAQITRMVIAADGKGYALSNDGNHLMQFTTKKKPEIKDLGALTDDLTNGRYSIHSSSSWGGDMIGDKEGNLYMVTANASVYKISPETMVASFIGKIKGLPRGFSTNGAIAEGDSKVIVSSSSQIVGYYRFDLNTLQAEKISTGASVFNASDLANGALAFERKEKKVEEKLPEQIVDVVETKASRETPQDAIVKNAISVYPNPVTSGYFKLSFADQAPGRYQIQLTDIAGKVMSTQIATINLRMQVEEFKMPQKVAAGNYLVRVINEATNVATVTQLVVQ